MSNALPNKILSGDSKVTIPAGDIQFYDRFSPPLETGAYTLEAQQTVQKVDSGEDVKFPADAPLSKPFRVEGPRFNLPGAYIHQQYPPANHIGGFANDLPNIVFKDARALPWQRSVVDFSKTPDWSVPPQGTPWMALSTFRDSELQAGGPVGKPVSITVPDLLQPAANVLVPQINPTLKQKEEMARVMTVDYEFFKAVGPQQGEMHYLAHGREVDTAGKVILGVEGTGFFSLVVGNRAVKEGQENTLVLVSLEGHWERLAGGSDTDHPGAHIRLVVLASWQATAIESPGDFLVLLQQLSERDGGLSLYRLPAAGDTGRTGDPSCDPKAQAREVVELGMVPMPNDLRIGEKTTSYDHGPFVAAPMAQDSTYGPFHYSDATIHYDPVYGTLNLSYAAAYQIGRLLALSDSGFARAVFQWRKDYYYRLMRSDAATSGAPAAVNRAVSKAVAAAAAELGSEGLATDFPDGPPDRLNRVVAKFLHGSIGAKLRSDPAFIPQVRLRQRKEGEQFSHLPTKEEVDKVKSAGGDPLMAMFRLLSQSRPARSPGEQP